MPALIHFRRKWLIACDDFVIPFAVEAFIRLFWLVASLLITFLNIATCDDSYILRYLLYTIIGDLSCTGCLCLIISVLSARGSVLEVQKRVHLSKILYVKCVTILVDVAIASFSIWLLQQESNICIPKKVFILVTTACLWLYLLVVIVGVFICYNSLGSSQYWNAKSADSIKLFKKAERKWRFRLKFFCCCADISEEGNDFIYVEISTFLATVSRDFDVAPTDVLAGLIALSKIHAVEKRKPVSQEVLSSDAVLVSKTVPFWMTAENALYFLRVAKSTYGWLAFFDPLQPWKLCTLLSSKKCFLNCFGQHSARKDGDCGDCNSSAVEKISGFSDSEILYASFCNSIYEPAFVIILDHEKKSLIIAVRGTCSFSDVITDFDGEHLELQLEMPSPKLKCHRGALRSALYIKKKVQELNILSMTFVENPTYTLVLCGHSLGGSIATILGLLLLPEYPSLQCYAYAPMPVISKEGVFLTLDFVFAIAVGDDMVIRMSLNSVKELMTEMHKALEETQIPKYRILLKAFQYYLRKHLKMSKKPVLSSEVYENKNVQIDESAVKVEISESHIEHQQGVPLDETHLYTPGRILHLKRGEKYEFSWITGFHLQKLIISPYLIKDHQPHQIQFFLEKYESSIETSESGENVEPEDILTKL